MESDSLTASSAALIAALRDPARYPHPVERIDVLETHIVSLHKARWPAGCWKTARSPPRATISPR